MGARDVGLFDARLQHPFSLIVSGPSNSGKTYFVKTLIENVEKVISQKIENIVYIYSCWQPLYDDLVTKITTYSNRLHIATSQTQPKYIYIYTYLALW